MSSAMDKLMGAVNKAKQSGGSSRENDDVFYYPVRDAVGNASVVIRFLPPTDEAEEQPFVKVYSHGFKNTITGKWLIENCPTTLDRDDCPVCKANGDNYTRLQAELGEKAGKAKAREFGMNRKTSFISRILVIEDKKTPENEGKVFLYKFGSKIFDKVIEALAPVDEDDKAYNVFGLSDKSFKNLPLADFKLKVRKVDNQVNYDKSTFEVGEPTSVDFRAQFTAENEIQKLLLPENFKTAEALQKRLDIVVGNTTRVAAAEKVEQNVREEEFEQVKKPAKTESKRVVEKAKVEEDEDDDIMNLVRSLASED